jgi:hypothetical protein
MALGKLQGRTLEQGWMLIEAALHASGRLRRSSN